MIYGIWEICWYNLCMSIYSKIKFSMWKKCFPTNKTDSPLIIEMFTLVTIVIMVMSCWSMSNKSKDIFIHHVLSVFQNFTWGLEKVEEITSTVYLQNINIHIYQIIISWIDYIFQSYAWRLPINIKFL